MSDKGMDDQRSPSNEGDTPAPSKAPSRRATMSAARLERRRAVDRESQRATRARNKAYIAHLEQTIANMEQNSTDEHTASLMKQVKQQQDEIDRLNGLVGTVRKLLNGGPHGYRSADDIAFRIADIGDYSDAARRHLESDAAGRLLLEDDESEDMNSSGSKTICPFTTALTCGTSETRNYFGALNTALEFIQTNARSTVCTGFDEATDDDIVIRAVLHGWPAVEKKYDLDLGWQLLKAIDQGLYRHSEAVVRIANLRSMRATMMHKLYPGGQNRRPITPYMNPTTAQKTVKHPGLVDYFVWPQVRDYLLFTNTTRTSEVESASFARNLRFIWQYELRDVCRKHKETGLYSYSETFDKAFNDLGNWVMAPEFFVVSSMSPLLLTPKSVGFNPNNCAREYLRKNGARGHVWDLEGDDDRRKSRDETALATIPGTMVSRAASIHPSPPISASYLPDDAGIIPSVGENWPNFDWNTPEFEWMR